MRLRYGGRSCRTCGHWLLLTCCWLLLISSGDRRYWNCLTDSALNSAPVLVLVVADTSNILGLDFLRHRVSPDMIRPLGTYR